MLSYIIKEKGNLKKAYKMRKAAKKIRALDLFDSDFYLRKYPDVKKSRLSPLDHYLYHGFKESKQPGRLFDNNFYLKKYGDVRQSGENPLVHYVLHGKREGRQCIKSPFEDKIKSLKRRINNQNKILDSYNQLFNDLYINHETIPKGTLKDMQDLCLELLVFFDNICKKYDIYYWLDYGSLLGPVRHGGYLPWDDDVDIGMLITEFDRLVEALEYEIKANNMQDYISILEKKKYNDSVTGFIQVLYKRPGIKNMFAGVDILPYQYLKNEDNLEKIDLKNQISDKVEVTQKEFLERDYFNTHPEQAYKELTEIVGVVDEEDDYIIPAAVNLRPKRIRVYKKEEIFPLQRIKFEQYDFYAANDEKAYLTMSYGEDYMKLPKRVSFHTRMQTLKNKNIENLHEKFEEELERLRKVNENFN